MTLLIIDQNSEINLTGWKLDALQAFKIKMTDKEKLFPCIPATQAFALHQLRYGFCDDPREESTAQTFASLIKEYTNVFKSLGHYTSLIIFFHTPQDLITGGSVEYFEELFWKQLNRVSMLDECDWPEKVPIDPHEHLWEYCFHGEPYFIFCATPLHQKRYSRHFPYMMLAITPRWVLTKFNQQTTHAAKIKKQIRKRLQAYDSLPAHPHLHDYGHIENYEWKQYFLHDDETAISACPFHRHLTQKEDATESEI
jgi:uncharacterized protein